MSKPASRLSAFRSYSYYHVLVMCDSTDTADRLTQSTQIDAWHHTTDATRAADSRPNMPNLGKYSPKCVTDENGNCVGRYIVLIDGSTDAAFAINQVKVTSATASNAVNGNLNTSLAVEGSILISEPKGVAFLDQVVRCSIALGIDNSQVVYGLKTFFVGYTYDEEHGDVPLSISDIPPVNFITYDVTGSFTEQGGTYEMLFVAIANGAARLPQYSKAVSSMNFRSGTSLKSTFDNLQLAIRANYDRYFACVQAQLESLGTPEALQLRDSLCGVTYTIAVGAPYDTDTSYVVTDGPVQYNNTGTCDSGVAWSFPPNSSIESAIATIMGRCEKVQDDMSTGDPSTQVKYEYKIHSCVKSTPVSGSDTGAKKMQYEVRYRVDRTITPRTIANDSGFAKFAQDEDQLRKDPIYNTLRKNVIEFDYIYTGNNTDILEFDIKVNMGLAYLQTATLSNTFKGQLESAPTLAQGISQQSYDEHKNSRFIPGPPVQTPVFFGKQIAHPKTINKKDANAAIQGAYTLAKHASLEVAEASMRIAGNDRLLATVARTTSAGSMVAGAPKLDDAPGEPTEADFKYWTYVPAYAKINIKMPRDNDDFTLFTGQTSYDGTSITSNADYARDFWFDGYYYVVGIEHVFENGEFTQTLDMISIPKTSAFGSTKGSSEASFDVKLDECYDSTTGCGKTPASTPPTLSKARIPETPPVKPAGHQTHNQQDIKSILKNSTSLSHVKGWETPYTGKINGETEHITISQEVKTAINRAAADTGVDSLFLAQMCYQESKFRPKATNPSSSAATGLFQFVKTTWFDLGRITKGRDAVLTPAVTTNLNSRLDPYLNAYAAAIYALDNTTTLKRQLGDTFSPTPSDLYLAHFAGAGGASWIIKADQETGGTATLTYAYRKRPLELDKLIKENSPYITRNMTTQAARAWAASKLATALINPMSPVTSQKYPVNFIADLADGNLVQKVIARNTVKAKDKVSAQQDCKVQDEKAKEEKQPCNTTPSSPPPPPTQQDKPRRGRGATTPTPSSPPASQPTRPRRGRGATLN